MAKIAIVAIEIDDAGRLLVVPEAGADYGFIYRMAAGVNWNSESACLVAPSPEEWSYLDWFETIYSAVRSEYGDQLCISGSTTWTNVPSELRDQIVISSGTIEARLASAAEASREASHREGRKRENQRISLQAGEAFRARDYSKTVELLSTAEPPLSAADEKKLRHARAKLGS